MAGSPTWNDGKFMEQLPILRRTFQRVQLANAVNLVRKPRDFCRETGKRVKASV